MQHESDFYLYFIYLYLFYSYGDMLYIVSIVSCILTCTSHLFLTKTSTRSWNKLDTAICIDILHPKIGKFFCISLLRTLIITDTE